MYISKSKLNQCNAETTEKTKRTTAKPQSVSLKALHAIKLSKPNKEGPKNVIPIPVAMKYAKLLEDAILNCIEEPKDGLTELLSLRSISKQDMEQTFQYYNSIKGKETKKTGLFNQDKAPGAKPMQYTGSGEKQPSTCFELKDTERGSGEPCFSANLFSKMMSAFNECSIHDMTIAFRVGINLDTALDMLDFLPAQYGKMKPLAKKKQATFDLIIRNLLGWEVVPPPAKPAKPAKPAATSTPKKRKKTMNQKKGKKPKKSKAQIASSDESESESESSEWESSDDDSE